MLTWSRTRLRRPTRSRSCSNDSGGHRRRDRSGSASARSWSGPWRWGMATTTRVTESGRRSARRATWYRPMQALPQPRGSASGVERESQQWGAVWPESRGATVGHRRPEDARRLDTGPQETVQALPPSRRASTRILPFGRAGNRARHHRRGFHFGRRAAVTAHADGVEVVATAPSAKTTATYTIRRAAT